MPQAILMGSKNAHKLRSSFSRKKIFITYTPFLPRPSIVFGCLRLEWIAFDFLYFVGGPSSINTVGLNRILDFALNRSSRDYKYFCFLKGDTVKIWSKKRSSCILL